MPKKIDYAAMFTRRKDGRYMGYWHELDKDGHPTGPRHAIYDQDPEKLYLKIQTKESADAAVPTFETIAESWKSVRFEALSYKTVEAYAAPYRRLIDRFGDEPIDEIETRDVNAYLDSLARQGFAKRTVQLHRDMMGQIYSAAIADGLAKYNPCDHASMPKNLPAGTRGIAPEPAIEAVKRGVSEPFGLFAFLCLYAGLRRGEALALCYEDVDRKARVIHVTKSVEFVGNNPHLKDPKTKSGRRDVILLDVLADAIPNGKGYLFADDGKLLTRDQYRKR